MVNTQLILTQLKGSWTLQRTLSEQGNVHGIAHFKQVGTNLLHYREEGIFTHLNNNTNKIEREYFYYYDIESDKIRVYFAHVDKPGELLHELGFMAINEKTTTVTATALHKCRADIYKATYNFYGPDQFKLIYIVQGPAKNYISETLFTRC